MVAGVGGPVGVGPGVERPEGDVDAAHLLEVHPNRVGGVAEQGAIFLLLLLLFLLGDLGNPILFLLVVRVRGERTLLGDIDGDLGLTVTEQRDHGVDLLDGGGIGTERVALTGRNVLALAAELDDTIDLIDLARHGRGALILAVLRLFAVLRSDLHPIIDATSPNETSRVEGACRRTSVFSEDAR